MKKEKGKQMVKVQWYPGHMEKAKRGMLEKLKAVDINTIPVKEKTELRNMIINQSNSIQESLEKSAESDRTGKLSSIIKNNKVTIQ